MKCFIIHLHQYKTLLSNFRNAWFVFQRVWRHRFVEPQCARRMLSTLFPFMYGLFFLNLLDREMKLHLWWMKLSLILYQLFIEVNLLYLVFFENWYRLLDIQRVNIFIVQVRFNRRPNPLKIILLILKLWQMKLFLYSVLYRRT